MNLPNSDITLYPDGGQDGWIFSTRGGTAPNEIERAQGSNPTFTRDYLGNEFVAGNQDLFLAYNPSLARDKLAIWVTWNADGTYTVTSPAEQGNSGSFNSKDTLDVVSGRSPYVEASDADSLSTYQRHPLDNSKVLIRAFTWPRIWAKLLDTLTATADILSSLKYRLGYTWSDMNGFSIEANPEVSGNNSYISRVNMSAPFNTGHIWLDENGVERGRIGYLPNANQIGISDDSGHYIKFVQGSIGVESVYFSAVNSKAIFRDLELAVAPIASTVSPFAVLESDPVTGHVYVRQATPAQVLSNILPGLQTILSNIDSAGGTRKRGTVTAICYYVENVPADPVGRFTIIPSMVGVPQPHNLQTANLFPILLNASGGIDDTMVLSYTNEIFTLSYPAGITSGYEGGKLRLEAI